MDWKRNGLWIAALIGMVIAGSAITATVNSITEAQQQLGTSSNIQQIGCKVYTIEKTATTQNEITNNDWQVTFAMEYTIDGRQTREGVKTAMVKDNTEAAVKTAVASQCEQDWANAQARHGTIDTVVIQTTANDNSVLAQIYNASKKTWANISAQQVEP